MKVMVSNNPNSEKLRNWLYDVGYDSYVMPMDVDAWPDIRDGLNITETPALVDNNDRIVLGVDNIKDTVRSFVLECKNS